MTAQDAASIMMSLERLFDRTDASEEYIQFRIDLFKAQRRVYDALVDVRANDAVDSDQAYAVDERELAEPIRLRPDDVDFDATLLMIMLQDLHSAGEQAGRSNPGVEELLQEAEARPQALVQLALQSAFAADDDSTILDLSERLQADADAIRFLGRALAAPSFTAAIDQFKVGFFYNSGKTSHASVNHCPYCTSEPGISVVQRGEGRRRLCCGLCAGQWEFPRAQCPFCQDRQQLEILALEDSDPRWIEACNGCGHYFKTVDLRRIPESEEVAPLVEAVATLYLEIIAANEGYEQGRPYVAIR